MCQNTYTHRCVKCLNPLVKVGIEKGIRTRVFVALQHQLRIASARIPELHTTILRATEYPIAVGGQSDAQHEILGKGQFLFSDFSTLGDLPCDPQKCGYKSRDEFRGPSKLDGDPPVPTS